MRGKILKLTRSQVRDRWLSQLSVTKKNRPIRYLLKDYNGGFDPEAANCASIAPDKTLSADCIGFVLWGSGIDRKQPGYQGSLGEWLNCRSLLYDAETVRKFCRFLVMDEVPEVGDWLMTEDHIGGIVRPACEITDHLVVDCSPRHGRAMAVGVGYPWSKNCRVVRPVFYVP